MRGYAAYSQTMGTAQSGRDTEYRLLGNVTSALLKANEDGCPMKERLNALLWNQKVWNAFLSDLSHPENSLPQDLKDKLISLALWVFRETELVMEDKANMDALINVNRNIMEGLKAQMSAVAAS